MHIDRSVHDNFLQFVSVGPIGSTVRLTPNNGVVECKTSYDMTLGLMNSYSPSAASAKLTIIRGKWIIPSVRWECSILSCLQRKSMSKLKAILVGEWC